MRGRRALWLLLILAPSLTGLVIAIIFTQGWLGTTNQRYSLQFDMAGLALRLGIMLSCLVLATALIALWGSRREAQAQRREAAHQTHSRRDFLRRLDHELKNPLTIIHLGTVNLQQSPGLSPAEAETARRIGEQTRRLQKLVTDLRWLADLEESEVEQAAVDLEDVLTDAIELVQEASHGDTPVVSLQMQQTPWPVSAVTGDRELLVLAFRNLIENACKYAAGSDRVDVRVAENGKAALVEIADTGPGIRYDEQPLIFEHLYRGKDAHGIPGSGLGLSIVRRIITLHGGEVSLRSRPQAGTVFTVQLPLAREPH